MTTGTSWKERGRGRRERKRLGNKRMRGGEMKNKEKGKTKHQRMKIGEGKSSAKTGR